MIWGQTKLGFTLGGHLVVVPRHGVVWGLGGGGGTAAERQLHDVTRQATSKLFSEPSSLPGCLHVLPHHHTIHYWCDIVVQASTVMVM